ncbi:hypothetical protein PTKIN_Ptkin11bG0178000 [Pterospermum kingtungense]
MHDIFFTIPYGFLLEAGGFIWYVKKGSIASLAGGKRSLQTPEDLGPLPSEVLPMISITVYFGKYQSLQRYSLCCFPEKKAEDKGKSVAEDVNNTSEQIHETAGIESGVLTGTSHGFILTNSHHISSSDVTKAQQTSSKCINNVVPLDLGGPIYACSFCGAQMWYEERLAKSREGTNPRFSLCCIEGKVSLPSFKQTPSPLAELMDYRGGKKARLFRDNIRFYNSMFQFTSIGGKIDGRVNRKPGPYVFRINGQNHHKLGSLLPMDGQKPKFA